MTDWIIRNLKASPFLRNSAVLFGGTMAANILNYVFHFAVGRIASPETYGEMEAIISLLAIVSVPAAAIGLVATKFASAAKADGDRGRSAAVLRYLDRRILLVGVPMFALALLLTPYVERLLRTDATFAIVAVWVLMLLSFFSGSATGLLAGWQRFGDVSRVNVVSASVKLVVGVGLVALGFGANGASGGFLLAGIVGYAVARLLIASVHRASAPEPVAGRDGYDLSAIRPYVLPVFLGMLAVAALGNADMVLAKHHLDPAAAGAYGALFIVGKTIFFVASVIATVLFAMSAEDEHRGGATTGFPRPLRNALILTAVVCAGSVAVFSAFPTFVLGIFFGAKYAFAAPYLPWIAVSAALYSFANLFIQYLLSVRMMGAIGWFLLVAAVETAGIAFFGENMYAIIGITILTQSAAVAVGAVAIARNLSLRRRDAVATASAQSR